MPKGNDGPRDYTPGAWERAGNLIWAPRECKVIASASALVPKGNRLIFEEPDMLSRDWMEIQGNAQLLSAAPELKDAVKKFMDAKAAFDKAAVLIGGAWTNHKQMLMVMEKFEGAEFEANGALAKARGER